MAARLIRIDASSLSCVVECACGHRVAAGSRLAATRAARDHMAAAHPAALRRTEKQRRHRARRRMLA